MTNRSRLLEFLSYYHFILLLKFIQRTVFINIKNEEVQYIADHSPSCTHGINNNSNYIIIIYPNSWIRMEEKFFKDTTEKIKNTATKTVEESKKAAEKTEGIAV